MAFPQGISYQAVAYDSDGFEISNQDISVRLGILLGGVDAEASFCAFTPTLFTKHKLEALAIHLRSLFPDLWCLVLHQTADKD